MSEAQTRKPRYDVDLLKAAELWNRDTNITKTVEDLFSTGLRVPESGELLLLPTHYDPRQGINIIGYDEALKEAQEDIGRYFEPGEVFICVKHHKPEHPTLESAGKEAVKFDATHISVGVIVQALGKDGNIGNGAITISNPRHYVQEYGLFGTPAYPMIFLKLKFPSGINPDQQLEYFTNIRTWLVIANTYTEFPGEYNGGDPLATRSVSAIKTLGDNLIDVLVGTFEQKQLALEWLRMDANMIYCAELAHIAVNLGIHYPLNTRFLGERFDSVRRALETKDFLFDNENRYARLVDLSIASESLQPITEVIGLTPTEPGPGEAFGHGLAFRPMTMMDLVEEFVQLVPRKELGEQRAAPIQAKLFGQVRSGLIEQMALDQLQPDEPPRLAVEQLMDDIEDYLVKPAWSYQEFREGLKPLLDRASEMSGPRPDGSGAFLPPHAWLLLALSRFDNDNCVMDTEVVGHGLHASILKPKTH